MSFAGFRLNIQKWLELVGRLVTILLLAVFCFLVNDATAEDVSGIYKSILTLSICVYGCLQWKMFDRGSCDELSFRFSDRLVLRILTVITKIYFKI